MLPINLHEVSETHFQMQQDPNLIHALQQFLSEASFSFQVQEHGLIEVQLTAIKIQCHKKLIGSGQERERKKARKKEKAVVLTTKLSSCSQNQVQQKEKLHNTWRLTPQSGKSSVAAATNSFPYLDANDNCTCSNSGRSAHLGAAKHTLEMASFKSRGHSLNIIKGSEHS